jgi:hypothetical protein
MRIVIISLLLFSCTKTPYLSLTQKTSPKVNIDFSESFEKLNKVKIIQPKDKIDKNKKIICLYSEDYQEEIHNYRKLLDIVKKYQLLHSVQEK